MPERPGTDGSEPPVHRPYDRGESTTPDGVMAEPNTLPPRPRRPRRPRRYAPLCRPPPGETPMTGFPRTPRPHEKRWCGTHIGRARRHRCRFRAPARADRRSAFQAVPALLRSRRCAVSLRFAGRCWPVAVKMQPRREPQQSRWRRWQGNADLWPVLPVGAGTAARSAAKGVPPPEHKRDQARERRPPVGTAARSAAKGVPPPEHKRGLARERRPPVGTAARSAAKGVYHPAVWTTLNAGVPAERRNSRTRGPSRRPSCGGKVPKGGRRSLARASLHEKSANTRSRWASPSGADRRL